MSGKCEDLNPGTDISNASPLAEAIGGPLSQCRPSGHFTTFISRDDVIHKGDGGYVNGINTRFPNIPGYTDGSGNAMNGGELAEAFDGYIDLDWESDTFGEIDGNYGFLNTKLGQILWGQQSSVGVYQDNNKSDQYYYDAIKNHPNTANSIKLQLMSLKKWADFHKISHEEIEKRFRANDKTWMADNYKVLVDNNIEYSDLIEGGMINHLTAKDKNFGTSDGDSSSKEEIETAEEFLTNEVDGIKNGDADFESTTIGIGDVEAVTDVFREAPSKFGTAFGLGENKIVILKYPHDAVYGESGGVAGQDHIVIEQFQYQAPQAVFLDKKAKRTTLSYLNGIRRNSNIKAFVGQVRMPIPNNLSFSNGVSWGDSKLNAVQAAAFFSAFSGISGAVGDGNIVKGLDSVGKDLASILGEIKEGALGTGEPANLALSSFLAQFALGRAGINVDGGAALTRGTGAAINPNLELLFNGPKLRNFTFSFQFAPNDELDAKIMRRIQKFFKMGMSPVRNSQNLVFLGSPNVFRLRYRTQEDTRIKGLPMHKICALTQCEINYAPDGVYQSYEDSAAGSSPVRTVMNMSFTELTPIFQDDYLGEDEIVTNAGRFTNLETFNDLTDTIEGVEDKTFATGMEPITAEDTGF
jgi:hypothetical protein